MNAVLLIVIPLLVGFISILVKKYAHYLVLATSVFNVVMLLFIEKGSINIGGFNPVYSINLLVDDYSYMGLFILNILFLLVVSITVFNYKKVSSVLLVALAGLNGLLLTNDLFNLFVFLEVAGIAAYLITTTNKKPLSTFNYLVLGTVGSSFYLLGLIILYNMFGTINMSELPKMISAPNLNVTFLSIPLLFMFIGLGVEAKILPFNSWVKGVLGNANTLSGTMIASVYAAVITLVFGRVLTSIFATSEFLGLIITVILLVSILAGEMMAYSSTKAREILLFSSVSQAGLAVAVFAAGLPGWALVMVGVNAFTKFVLFMVVTTITEQTNSDELEDLKGVFSTNKTAGTAFTVSVLSAIGLPLFVGFVVKINVLIKFAEDGNFLLPAVLLIASIIEGVYFIKMLVTLWYGEKKEVNIPVHITAVAVVIAAMLVVYGVVTEDIVELVTNVTTQMLGGPF